LMFGVHDLCVINDYRERLGQIPAGDITELPQGWALSSQQFPQWLTRAILSEYKDLETRVDALRQTHLNLLK